MASAEVRAEVIARYGLDKPLLIQFLDCLRDFFLRGDLGLSLRTRHPVTQDLITFLPASLELLIGTAILCIPTSILLGVIGATRKDRLPDHAIRIFALGSVAMPPFWIGVILQLVFACWLGVLPVGGRIALEAVPKGPTGMYLIDSLVTFNSEAFVSSLTHLVLPTVTLTFGIMAPLVRMTRSSMLDFLGHDSIRTARASGLSERRIIYKYALRNSMLATTTHVGMVFGTFFGYTVLVEKIFVYPGLGKYVTDSILYLDYPGVVGATVVLALLVTVINLIVDLLYSVLNPKIRYG
jgi:peptide/nickel transport system permease protein